MIEVFILALALSMDSFAVSIGLGASKQHGKIAPLGIIVALYFGLFQGVMPIIGFLGGKGLLSWTDSYTQWIAFLLLFLIGTKMIYESFSAGIEGNLSKITHRVLLILAIATSIDAMAAGFSLNLLPVNPFLACFIIGIITFFFSWLGVLVGIKGGTWLESKAEFVGGITLIMMSIKILLTS
ncbi:MULTISPECIES: manganese efflux pump MntP [Colwellia]|uniref:Putative manganese efflux pump MntP n=1 Tax=Colwellia marinimaniae TaxID=1513592 RepID=A0ABQ0MY95_9GAMM|nr:MULTISPECIES: manganese efflux pump MntP family protein [Colwellia]GAW97338.1 putative manganese efflux pump MntP [Colwellia marinimaniae]